jgi:hypothetical protein
MAFFNLVDWTLIVNIENWDMEKEVVVGNIKQQVLVIFGKLNEFEFETFACTLIEC